MALTPTDFGDNAFGPVAVAADYLPDQLIAGNLKVVTDTVTLTGAAALPRGTVLGRIDTGDAVVAQKAGNNTGNGTFVIDADTPILSDAQDGVYNLTCSAASGNAATFGLFDPHGNHVHDYAFSGSGGNVTVSDQIKGLLTDGVTDFVVGDGFTVTVTLAAGKWKKAVKTASDGSQFPRAVLIDAADPSAGNISVGIIKMAEVNAGKLTYDSSFSAEDIKLGLEAHNIYVKSAVSAADPT